MYFFYQYITFVRDSHLFTLMVIARAPWRNVYNAEEFDRRVGKVTTERSGKPKVSREPGAHGRPGRIADGRSEKKGDDGRDNVGSPRFDIPSAGSIGDPINAAYPEFDSLIPKIEDDKSDEDSPNKDWEVVVAKSEDDKKIGKLKNNPNNIREKLDGVFVESNRIDNPYMETYPEMGYEYGTENGDTDDEYDDDSAYDSQSEDDYSYDEETTARTPEVTRKENDNKPKVISTRRPPNRQQQRGNRPETIDDRSTRFSDSSFTEKAVLLQESSGPSDDRRMHPARQFFVTSEKSTEQRGSTKPTAFKNVGTSVSTTRARSYDSTEETAFTSGIETSKGDHRPIELTQRTTTPTNDASTVQISRWEKYNQKYNPTKKTLGTTDAPQQVTNLKNYIESSSNLTKTSNESKVDTIPKFVSFSTDSIDSTTPATENVTKQTVFKKLQSYFERYIHTTVSTLNTTHPKKYSDISSNATQNGNGSQSDGKLYRYSKDLRGLNDDDDVVNQVLKSMNRSTERNSVVPETTTIKNEPTSFSTPRTGMKLDKVNFYIKKYGVTKIKTLDTSTRASFAADTAVPPQANDPKKEVELIPTLTGSDNGSKSDGAPWRYSKNSQLHPDDVVNKILMTMRSSTADRPTVSESTTSVAPRSAGRKKSDKNRSNDRSKGDDKDHRRNGERRKGVYLFRKHNGTKPTIKPDIYADVKVETELNQHNVRRVKLPKRLEFDSPAENAKTKVVHRDDDEEMCKTVCEKCWKRNQVEVVNGTVSASVEKNDDSFETKSNIDSGLIDSLENVTRSNSETDLEPNASRDDESSAEIFTTKKPRGRKRGKTSTKIMKSTTERTKPKKGGSRNDDRSKRKRDKKKQEKPMNEKENNGKNGNGKKRRKTTAVVNPMTEVPTTEALERSSGSTAASLPVGSSRVPMSSTKSASTKGSNSSVSESTAMDSKTNEPWGSRPDDETRHYSREPPSTLKPERTTEKTTANFPETPSGTVPTAITACNSLSCWTIESLETTETSAKHMDDASPIARETVGHSPTSKDITTASLDRKSTVLPPAITIDNEPESTELPRSDEKKTEVDVVSESSNENNEVMSVSEEVMLPNKYLTRSNVDEVTTKFTVTTSTTASGWFNWKWLSDSKEAESSDVSVKQSTTDRYDWPSTTSSKSEFNTPKTLRARCRADQHFCDGYNCIDQANVCDHIFHCHDGTDEQYCLWQYEKSDRFYRCRDDQHVCDRTVCLEIENVCDGRVHCRDGSDEQNCTHYIEMKNEFSSRYSERNSAGSSTTTTRPAYPYPRFSGSSRPRRCHPEFEFTCSDGSCIDNVRECDGIRDCVNGEDEAPSNCGGRKTRHIERE